MGLAGQTTSGNEKSEWAGGDIGGEMLQNLAHMYAHAQSMVGMVNSMRR